MRKPKVIISGGGTGGHIFPAISIANAVKEKCPEADILFVGALGRMEMQRVPQAGYRIEGLPVTGFDRKNLLKNVRVLWNLYKSKRMARRIVRDFRPDVAVGVGGYASGPMLDECCAAGVPCLIQEQNSYAGVTNKLLAKKVRAICVAYEGMERFFPKEKIVLTGNPVRQNILSSSITKAEALKAFSLQEGRKTIFIVGGSLGARTLNESVLAHLGEIAASGAQIVWQTGKYYAAQIAEAKAKAVAEGRWPANLHETEFISDMAAAFKAADLMVSRAGASSISEFCLIGKPVILVPSPNVAEDHQTKNAMALVKNDAAIYIKDAEAKDKLIAEALKTVADDALLSSLHDNILKLALPDSANIIADMALKLVT